MSHHPTCRTRETGLIAVIRGTDADTAIEVVKALTHGGASTVKVTADIDDVLSMLRDVSASLMADEVTVGTRTVLDNEAACVAPLAGAEYLVTPTFDEGVIRTGNKYGIPLMVGIVTPTEAVNTHGAGAEMAKVFPAGTLGPKFVSTLGGSLGHTPTIPTGDVALDTVDEFFGAGTAAVDVGNAIVDNDAISRGGFATVEASACPFVETAERARRD